MFTQHCFSFVNCTVFHSFYPQYCILILTRHCFTFFFLCNMCMHFSKLLNFDILCVNLVFQYPFNFVTYFLNISYTNIYFYKWQCEFSQVQITVSRTDIILSNQYCRAGLATTFLTRRQAPTRQCILYYTLNVCASDLKWSFNAIFNIMEQATMCVGYKIG